MKRATFYHAGCAVCRAAENELVRAMDRSQVSVEIVHLGKQKDRIDEAVKAGVESVPALVIDGNVFHINFGASINNVRLAMGPSEKDQEEVVAGMRAGWGIR